MKVAVILAAALFVASALAAPVRRLPIFKNGDLIANK